MTLLSENYELIVTIVNKGGSERVIHVAREAGAAGATVLRARGSGLCGTFATFLGVTVELEKEVILNIASAETADAIVEAISQVLDIEKKGTGICMIVPLRGVTRLFSPEELSSISAIQRGNDSQVR